MNIPLIIIAVIVYFLFFYWFAEFNWKMHQKKDKSKFWKWLLWPMTTWTDETGIFMEDFSEPVYKSFMILGFGAVKICFNLIILSIELIFLLCLAVIIIAVQILYTIGILVIKFASLLIPFGNKGWINSLRPFKFILNLGYEN